MKKTPFAVRPALAELRARMAELDAFNRAEAVLSWDMQVVMPHSGAAARGAQLAALKTAAHRTITSPELGRILRRLEDAGVGEKETVDGALVRWASRERRRKLALSEELVDALARLSAEAHQTWSEAREKSDYSIFRPSLKKMLALKRRQADAIGGKTPYDAWLGDFEPGMDVARVTELLTELSDGLIPLAREACARPQTPLDRSAEYDLAAQRRMCEEAAALIGFDLKEGRLDVSAHPFSTSLGPGDNRLTTRFHVNDPFSALYSTLHEAGHGMYEQNIGSELHFTPLAQGATMAVHESQSRLWENVIGRSRGFWKIFLPRFRELFPQASALDLEAVLARVNRVGQSPIRVEADELTYGLHILLRFDLEKSLLSGKVRVEELPEAWAERARHYLGAAPLDDRRGVLQDVHWSGGDFGYFPTYAIGNLIASQLFDAAVEKTPGLQSSLEEGDYAPLKAWLVRHVHRHGKRYGADDIVRRATGRKLTAGPYLKYLRAKHGASPSN